MKNIIKYYYDLSPKYVYQNDNQFFFSINKVNYVLSMVDLTYESANNLYEMDYYLLNKGIYVHQIIINRENSICTIVNGNQYILMKINISNRNIEKNDLIRLNSIALFDKFNIKWQKLWSDKVDYFENQINQIGKRYPIINKSIGYYIGLSENAISLIGNVNLSVGYLAHIRVSSNDSIYDLYNPINIIIDSRVRDISEYFKSLFFNNKKVDGNIILSLVKEYLISTNLSNDELILFYARMLYPSYYFDAYEDVMIGKINEKDLLIYINKSYEYELLLKHIYNYIISYYSFPEIEWIMLD